MIAAIVLARRWPDRATFPDDRRFSFRDPINAVVEWITHQPVPAMTDAIKDVVTYVLINPIEGVLTSAPWWLIVAVVVGVAWSSRAPSAGLVAAICLSC